MKYKYHPKTKKELIQAIKKEIYEVQGTSDNPNWNANLNCIDTSKITDMEALFSGNYRLFKFNGNISEWNVSNVENMLRMFKDSKFNGDISRWDASNVKDISWMFAGSKFNGNIGDWDVSNVENMNGVFEKSKFNQDISKWDVSGVVNIFGMFRKSKFNGDIGDWDISDRMRKETELNNISADEDSDIVPDRIVSFNTLKRIIKKGLLKEALTNIDKNILGDELFIVDGELRRHNEELVKKLLTKYRNIVFNKKELNKILGKNSDLLNKPYTKRIMEIYKRCDEKEEREKILAATVVIPYIKEKKERENRKDLNKQKTAIQHKYIPKTKEELVQAIKKEIFEVQGTSDNPNWEADLNCIDTSYITDMSFLFSKDENGKSYGLNKFNGNISEWNVGNVKKMWNMFYKSKFNGDISGWNIQKDTQIYYMFREGRFNGDIGDWNIPEQTKERYAYVKNISAKKTLNQLPDKIVSVKTLIRILKKEIPFEKWGNKIDLRIFSKLKETYPEFFIFNSDLRKLAKIDKNFIKNVLDEHAKNKISAKVLIKYQKFLDIKDYQQRLIACINQIRVKEDIKKAISAFVIAPYLKENISPKETFDNKNKKFCAIENNVSHPAAKAGGFLLHSAVSS